MQHAGRCGVAAPRGRAGQHMARHGLDAATLRAAHPRLVYCSITGFGQDGPYAQRAGYDFAVQGLGGLMSVTGAADGQTAHHRAPRTLAAERSAR